MTDSTVQQPIKSTSESTVSKKKKYRLDDFDQSKNASNVYFSPREAEVLVHMFDGLTAKESAEKLSISPRTVEFYRNNIKLKMGCRTKLELVRRVKDGGLEQLRSTLRKDGIEVDDNPDAPRTTHHAEVAEKTEDATTTA